MIVVNVVNDAPVANDDSVLANEETPVSINVFDGSSGGADSDVDDVTLTIAIFSDPNNGVVVLNADGTFVYTPDPNFYGQDSFVYTLSDAAGETATATGAYY